MEIDVFLSEIRLGFREPAGSPPPPHIIRGLPPPDDSDSHKYYGFVIAKGILDIYIVPVPSPQNHAYKNPLCRINKTTTIEKVR